MLKKEFIAGMVTGAIAFGGTGAAAGLLAQPSMQSIYVNGRPVYCTAYAISGNNYVRLRDIGQAVGFAVNYDWATDSVQISTGTQQAVQPAAAAVPTVMTAPQPMTAEPTQPTVTQASATSSRDYSQDANPEIFTSDLTRGFYNSAQHAYLYRKRWYLANVKLDMFISILYVNIANLKSVPIEIFAEILNVFMIVRNIRQNSDVFYMNAEKMAASFDRERRKADASLPEFLPSGMKVTRSMTNVCHELGGVRYNYEISDNSPYVYAYSRTDSDLNRPSVQSIIETAKRFDSDREKAEFLAETICDRLEYAYDRNIDSWNKAMDNGGKAVCSGYASAFNRMGRAAGLDVLTVGSKAGNHAWNIVYCDSEWLTVDLTHYDTSHNEANWFQPEHPKMKPDGLDEIEFAKEVLRPGSTK